MPSVKKVTKFPCRTNWFQYSKRWGPGRRSQLFTRTRGKRSSRTLALGALPTGPRGGACAQRQRRHTQRSHSTWSLRPGRPSAGERSSLLSLKTDYSLHQHGSSDGLPCLGLARLRRAAVRVRVGQLPRAFCCCLTPTVRPVGGGVLLSDRHLHPIHDA